MTKRDSDRANAGGERRPVTAAELRRRAICKKRYGRASLTIRRWGSFGVLIGNAELAEKVTAFRAGEASAEELSWAFVRARVESHSPTFRWKDADLERLIRLVTECSQSPHFEAQVAEALAAELVKTQDREREQIKRLSAQFAQSFAGLRSVSEVLQPQIMRWAGEQQRAMAALSKSFATPRLGALAAISTPTVHEQMRALGLTASVRKEMFPTLRVTGAQPLAGASSVGLLAQRVRLPDTIVSELSKSLNRSLGAYRLPAPALQALTRHRVAALGEVIEAAGEAAALVEQQGEREEARTLRAVSAEVIAVAEAPSAETLEQMVSDLSEHLNERLDELQEEQAANEERRQSDRRDDLSLNLLLWFLAIYFAWFLWMLEQLPRN